MPLFMAILLPLAHFHAQTTATLQRLQGTNTENHITYTRIFLTGTLTPPKSPAPDPPPTLTLECTRNPEGKASYDLFANFGGVADREYHRPWQLGDGGPFAPAIPRVIIPMEFLGYVHVKPFKRQWEKLDTAPSWFRYNRPAMKSTNLEDLPFFFQYLRSLPTLRLTYDGQSADFLTTPILTQAHAEPLCAAAGL